MPTPASAGTVALRSGARERMSASVRNSPPRRQSRWWRPRISYRARIRSYLQQVSVSSITVWSPTETLAVPKWSAPLACFEFCRRCNIAGEDADPFEESIPSVICSVDSAKLPLPQPPLFNRPQRLHCRCRDDRLNSPADTMCEDAPPTGLPMAVAEFRHACNRSRIRRCDGKYN